MLLLTPTNFPDYELIDCGDFEKIERFGKYITIRPEPQAVWTRVLSTKEWEKMAHVKFIPNSSSAGTWKKLKEMPDQWRMGYDLAIKKWQEASYQFQTWPYFIQACWYFP